MTKVVTPLSRILVLLIIAYVARYYSNISIILLYMMGIHYFLMDIVC